MRFHADGPLVLERYLPHWLSSFLSISWFWFIAFFAIIIPITSLLPRYRKFMFDIVLSQYYFQLFNLYRLSGEVKTKEEFEELFSQFWVINNEVISIWCPKGCDGKHSNMLQLLRNMTETFQMLESRFNDTAAKIGYP